MTSGSHGFLPRASRGRGGGFKADTDRDSDQTDE